MKTKIIPIQRPIDKERRDNNQMPLSECRRILNRNGNQFSDDEVIEIRDFISKLADIFISHYSRLENQSTKIINLEEAKELHYDESSYLRAG